MCGFDDKLCLFHTTMRFLGCVWLIRLFIRAQVVMSKLASRIVIPKELCVIKSCAEFIGNSIWVIGDIKELFLHEGLRCFLHGCKCRLTSLLIRVLIQEYLCLKNLSFGSRQTKLPVRNDLACTLTNAHVADREL